MWYEGAATTNRRFLQADERGSVIAVSDSAGASLAINRYDEYGIPQAGNAGRFQYTGQVWLPEAGLYWYKARMYSPSLGRFMQTDPIGYGDGLNWYGYVGGDPVNRMDPSGLTSAECTGVEICVTGPKSDGCDIICAGLESLSRNRGPDLNNSFSNGCDPGAGCTTVSPEAFAAFKDNLISVFGRNNNDMSANGSQGLPQSDEGADCVADPQSCITVVADRGKRNVIHSDHRGVPTDELLGRYNDPNTSAAEKRRLQESLKGLGVRNIRKRLPRGIPGLKRGIIGPLILTCLLAPVTCGLIDTDGNGVIDPDEVI